ncbi:hypothetical protein A2U01_0059432, partial [Trifolium medium]|nr:hypothetical protein [Trifolium medium]
EVARLNDVVAARSKEQEKKERALKKVKKHERSNEALGERIFSYDNDIKEYGHPAALYASWKQEREKLDSLNDRLKRKETIGIRAIATGFEEALKQVEKSHPEIVLDRSVFKPPSRATMKTQPPVAG